MLGAIAGDCIGSIYEWHNIKKKDFPLFGHGCRFTDDSILTVALADAILTSRDYSEVMREYYGRYPRGGYGGRFKQWARSPDPQPYYSFGNGSAMRTSPVAYLCDSLEETLDKAAEFASPTHNHPEGIKGGQVTAGCIYLAKTGGTMDEIREFAAQYYDISRTIDQIRPNYSFDVTCQGTVPEAIVCFLESTSFEDAIRNAISIGGDSDTLAAITGSIAEPFHGMPKDVQDRTMSLLDERLQDILIEFYQRYLGTCLEPVEHISIDEFKEVTNRQYQAIPKRSVFKRLFK